jgi:hypothetical protein
VLEGPDTAIEAAMARIAADPRHYGLVKLKDVKIDGPSFGGWAMLCRELNGNADNVIDLLGPLIREVDRSTRALFESFAEIRSKAA